MKGSDFCRIVYKAILLKCFPFGSLKKTVSAWIDFLKWRFKGKKEGLKLYWVNSISDSSEKLK